MHHSEREIFAPKPSFGGKVLVNRSEYWSQVRKHFDDVRVIRIEMWNAVLLRKMYH